MKKRPWLYVLGAVVLVLAVGFGAVAGAAVTYFVTRPSPVEAAMGFGQVFDDGESGLLISAVADDSAAAAAGLVRGDILMALDGTTVDTLPDLRALLADREPGDTVTLTVRHGDEVRDLEATLGDRDGDAVLGIGTCGCGTGAYAPGMGGMWFGGPGSEGPFPGGPMAGARITGVRITEIIPGSPAADADLAVGDVIVTVDGEDVGTDAGLAEMIQAYEPGDEVVLGVIAPDADGPRDVTVTLGEHPDQEGQAYLGIGYAPMTSMREFQWREMPFFNDDGEFQGELPEDFDPEEFFRGMPGMPGMRGFRALPDVELPEGVDSAAIIGAVTPGSPADDAGLATGDVVLAVNGESVDGPDALVAAVGDLAPGDEVTLTLLRSSEEVAVTVTLGENPDTPGAAYLGVMVGGFIRMERSGEPGGLFNFGDRFRDLDLPRRGGQDA